MNTNMTGFRQLLSMKVASALEGLNATSVNNLCPPADTVLRKSIFSKIFEDIRTHLTTHLKYFLLFVSKNFSACVHIL